MTNQWRAFHGFLHRRIAGRLAGAQSRVRPTWRCNSIRPSPTSVECVYVEGKNQWLWPLRAHIVFEFPARGNMPPVTVHTYQNMRGDFQDPARNGRRRAAVPAR